jgi:hypothetical protein
VDKTRDGSGAPVLVTERYKRRRPPGRVGSPASQTNDNAVVPNYKLVVRQADTPGAQDKIGKIVSFVTEEH